MKKTALTLAIGFISLTAQAANVVYDTDGNAGRVTYFNNAPIDAMVTQSSSAYELVIYTPHYTNRTPCQSAQVYDQNTDTLLTELSINFKTLTGQIPKGYENKEKYVQAQCTDEQGHSQVLRHKLGYAPKVQLNSDISVANWLDGNGFYPGYYEEVDYKALLNIDNGEPNGFCLSASLVGQIPSLLQEKHRYNLHSDVVNAQGKAKYNARSGVLVSEVICKSTGGTTRVVEIWSISENQQKKEISVDIY